MGPINGYSVLVTGGGSGIGEAAPAKLAADGANVTICGRTEEKLVAATDRIREEAAPNATNGCTSRSSPARIAASTAARMRERDTRRWSNNSWQNCSQS